MPCMHIAFSHCFHWHFLFADKRAYPSEQVPSWLPSSNWSCSSPPIALWGIFRYTLPAGVKLLRRCSELMVLYYVLSFILGQCFKFNFVTMMQDGQITPTATILTWIQSTMVLISVIASLIAGCHLYSKHRGNMRKLGIALILVFMVWLICSNLLPVAVFYLAGNTRQTALISVNIISMITTTSAYIYAYYMMYRAIKTKYFGDEAFFFHQK